MRPEQIRIEATERGFLDAEAAKEVISAFRDAGHPSISTISAPAIRACRICRTFASTRLKIDKSFVDTIGQDAASSSVASHIIDMAATLDVQVIAEGIEREEQAAYLHARGAQFGQGWLFSRAAFRRGVHPLRRAGRAGLDRSRIDACTLSRSIQPRGTTMNDQTATLSCTTCAIRCSRFIAACSPNLRARHEAEFGPVSPGEFLQIVINGSAYRWLAPLSTLIAAIDDVLDDDEATADARIDVREGGRRHVHAPSTRDPAFAEQLPALAAGQPGDRAWRTGRSRSSCGASRARDRPARGLSKMRPENREFRRAARMRVFLSAARGAALRGAAHCARRRSRAS